jgi:hypothetical protein
MATSRENWFYLAGCMLCVEVFMVALHHHQMGHPYVGNLLAVGFLYCLIQSFAAVPTKPTVLAVLLFAYGIEATQYVHLAAHLGLQHSGLALIVLGSHFEWIDMLAYTVGALLIWGGERVAGVVRPYLLRHA